MILDLERLPPDASRIVVDEVVVFNDVGGEERPIRCHLEVNVSRVGEAFYINVDVSGDLTTSCHKCLDTVRVHMAPSFEVVVQRSREAPAVEPEQAAEDFVIVPLGTSRFSLDRHIYENLVVEIPMQIVCSETCKGLCPGCGANLNNEACRCERATDPRWSELKSLKKRMAD